MSDENRGVYQKYVVKRTDGSHRKGRKHEHCSYFVLDLHHDPYAMPALKAYAKACRREYPHLARELDLVTSGDFDRDPGGSLNSLMRNAEPSETLVGLRQLLDDKENTK